MRRPAAERHVQPATLERVIRLLDSLIAPRIALKGGTALNVFHGALDRLSVDIDVNHVGEAEKARMEEDRPGLGDYGANAVPVLDLHEIVAGKHTAHGARSVRRSSPCPASTGRRSSLAR